MISNLTTLFQQFARRNPRRRRSGFRSGASEVLENRRMLTNFVVTSLADNEVFDGQVTLREAIVAANSNIPFRDAPAGGAIDSITFHESLFGEQISLEGSLSVAGNLTISGGREDGQQVTIDANDLHRVFEISDNADVVLENLVLQNGRSVSGSAVQNRGKLLLENVELSNNHAEQNGGAIANFGQLDIEDTLLSDNSADGHGGAIYSEGVLQIMWSDIVWSSSGGNGGGIYSIDGGVEIKSSTLANNSSGESGGAVFTQSQLLLQSSGVHDNSAGGSGGGVVSIGNDAVISNSTFAFNLAEQQGGGILAPAGSLTIVASTIVRNHAGRGINLGGHGGGIATGTSVTIASSIVAGNRSGENANPRHDDLLAVGDGVFNGSYTIVGDPNTAAGLETRPANTVGTADGGVLSLENLLSLDRDPTAKTLVLPLVDGSLAIDHGKSTHALDVGFEQLHYDQRGAFYQRVLSGSPDSLLELDAGAYEYRPFAPVIQRIETSEFTSTAMVAWQHGRSAERYEISLENLSSGQTGNNAYFSDANVFGSAWEFTDLPDGRYRIWLRGLNAEGEASEWSTRTFNVSTRPSLVAANFDATTGLVEYEWIAPPDSVRSEFYVVNRSLGLGPQRFEVDTVAGRNTDATFQASVGRHDVWARSQNSAGVWSRWSISLRHEVVPQLQSPATASFDVRPEFVWHHLDGVDSYEIWVQTGRDVLNVENIREPRFRPDVDLAAGEYRWWVRAHHISGWTPWSTPLSFNTSGRTEVYAKKEASFDSPVVSISFSTVRNAASYELYIRNVESREVVFHDNIGNTTRRDLPLPISGNYEVWARAIAEDGTRGTWSRPEIYKSNGPVFSNASAVLQDVTNTVSSRPTFSWDSQNGAASYDIVIWHDESQTEVKAQLNGSGRLVAQENLRAGEWTWFVRGRDAEGFGGEWVQGNHFFVGGETRLLAPVGETDEQRPRFIWQDVAGATGYELVVVDSNRNEVFRNNAIGEDAVSIQSDVDFAAGTYRVWIRIIMANGTLGPWSERLDFSVV